VIHDKEKGGTLIATPLKAFLDLVCLRKKHYQTADEIERDLRIEMSELRVEVNKYSVSEIEELAKQYKKKKAIFFEGREISYSELDENSNKVANGLQKLGIKKGDRVAIMLPNIPEFLYSFFGIQKLAAVAVPFNTMYKGREIAYILNDCEARVIITLSNFANLINEIRPEVPSLEYLVLTGNRSLVFLDPESTVALQFVVGRETFQTTDEAFQRVGNLLERVLVKYGVECYYKHRGSIRARGRKIANILVSEIENLLVINALCFVGPLPIDSLFKVVWVPVEVKDKVVEPMTSIEEESGKRPDLDDFRDSLFAAVEEEFNIPLEPGTLKRDELFGYEKAKSLATKTL
jgi:long-chain acyl-CoA synthetase